MAAKLTHITVELWKDDSLWCRKILSADSFDEFASKMDEWIIDGNNIRLWKTRREDTEFESNGDSK